MVTIKLLTYWVLGHYILSFGFIQTWKKKQINNELLTIIYDLWTDTFKEIF